jgi:predicted protein tyrosine phosphatase
MFPAALRGKRVICLDIPDEYGFMDAELIRLLWDRMTRAIPGLAAAKPD